ncbi:hypothetical protein [Amycolatopsis sp. H20-H5]|uniref:hypothetical protein n=1 Tax=Amycolatopsis sp. H20-H5 TaxID=3046309 RepID=UPI002DC049B8|nr:hypothetical protein [Amycolatopsis sp. H20-H5]MEC3982564.1 hypothetical protein [Amycolatopsis sp. H20-H5]
MKTRERKLVETRYQLNGLILLYAYLQRVFVHDRVGAGFPGAAARTGPDPIPGLLDGVGTAIKTFDKDAGLSAEDGKRLLETTGSARSLMRAHLPRPDAALPEQLASVAAALYAEEHVNNGLVHLGDIFDPEVADQFRQRIPQFRTQVGVITGYVGKVTGGEPLTGEENAQLGSWFTNVTGSAAHIEQDFQRIEQYLGT